MNGGILFLDLATTMGWCEGIPGEKPTSGTIRLVSPGATNPELYDALYKFLDDRFSLQRYIMVVMEAPQSPSHMAGKTNAKTLARLIGMCELTEWIAHRHNYFGRMMSLATVHDIRKHLLGFRPASGKAKREVIAAVRAKGFDPKDDNEADAIAGWLYAASLVSGKRG
jgi:hypothetical protein